LNKKTTITQQTVKSSGQYKPLSLTWVIDERKGPHSTPFLDAILQILEAHAVVNVFDVAHHKVLDKNVVSSWK